jgi:hypothetical protein
MQTLLFNTTNKEVKLFSSSLHESKLLLMFTDIPTVRMSSDGYYEVMKRDELNDRNIPVLRVPIANTNMLIER